MAHQAEDLLMELLLQQEQGQIPEVIIPTEIPIKIETVILIPVEVRRQVIINHKRIHDLLITDLQIRTNRIIQNHRQDRLILK